MTSRKNPQDRVLGKTITAAGVAVLLTATVAGAAIAGRPTETPAAQSTARVMRPEAKPLSDARILFELNATARDAGVQMLLDGEGWEWMKIYDTAGNLLLRVRADGSVGDVGVTELFFESAEPSLDDLPLSELLAMFPEGDYPVVARTVEGETLTGIAPLTHDIPSRAKVIRPNPDQPTDTASTVIRWRQPADKPGVTIDHYQIIVETDEDPLRILSVEVEADVHQMLVPPAFLQPATDYKLEVIAVEEGRNQTITEGTFSTK